MGTRQKLKMVIALGGNAITLPNEEGTISQQFSHTRQIMRVIADVIEAGHQVVLTHGNGPQVGNILRRVEAAAQQNVYPIPLEFCIADTQGGMGYMISQCLGNELHSRGIALKPLTVITTVVINATGPEYSNPTKPIGLYYTDARAEQHIKNDGWKMVKIGTRGWRRVVSSPLPQEIVEIDTIHRFVSAGELVVCCGGGGIPVCRLEDNSYKGVEAVIDKDRTAALLAAQLNMDLLVILTAVHQVCIRYGTPSETAISELTTSEAQTFMDAGEFPPGSMGPKIEAAIDFLHRSNRQDARVLITDHFSLATALNGDGGTWIRLG